MIPSPAIGQPGGTDQKQNVSSVGSTDTLQESAEITGLTREEEGHAQEVFHPKEIETAGERGEEVQLPPEDIIEDILAPEAIERGAEVGARREEMREEGIEKIGISVIEKKENIEMKGMRKITIEKILIKRVFLHLKRRAGDQDLNQWNLIFKNQEVLLSQNHLPIILTILTILLIIPLIILIAEVPLQKRIHPLKEKVEVRVRAHIMNLLQGKVEALLQQKIKTKLKWKNQSLKLLMKNQLTKIVRILGQIFKK
eukprot:TRINITY_DN605_c0_g1_i1.p2 TRINITY_DN605_c0_g1~~TRINITY_DN605_c0_g1_i1.p2  ORF type:complete len:255 (+),score=33.47 TRINITY_DN605_c0_g1_i1:220-984(+)